MKPVDLTRSGLRWSSGDYSEIALLDVTEEEIRHKLSTEFAEGIEEGLGAWKAMGLELGEGKLVELIKYSAHPTPGFIVRIDKTGNGTQALQKILTLLERDRSCVLWENIAG